ncbi:ABC transporter ATP-binding protein [Parvularcula dongshanensis]|uniref:ABC-type multidrug transport system ATPase subunit n=1 Tax=Parvularcula dongshanensis TaxID=1173995 RepID=A0A840I0F7_9PROT|nr:ABC transporter ATP-binding protein [Parvularcula dongshanensis]MBB4657825.1 ABC-type multidrug transport system ATPase subunit [Parvularcula dongshanensis]
MLRIEGLTKTYANGVRALDGVTLDVGRGMFGLLGPNGAGKSSLMRTLATLQDADSGKVDFDGIDVLRDPDPVRRQLGYLPQDFGVYPRISAIKLLDHIAVLKGLSDAKARRATVEALLRQTNLWDVRKKAPSTYSGGMRQRFGIAQALLGDPRLIIVDEPTAGLDPEERNRFHNLLSEIGENVVVILSTHIVEDVSDLCSDMAIMNGGRIAASGRPSDLIESVRGKIWRKVIDKAALEDHQARHTIVSARLVQGQTVVRTYSLGDPGDGFAPVEPTLEDVYFATIRDAVGPLAEAA